MTFLSVLSNGSKLSPKCPNGFKWVHRVKFCPDRSKLVKTDPNHFQLSKLVQIAPNCILLLKTAWNWSKLLITDQNCLKLLTLNSEVHIFLKISFKKHKWYRNFFFSHPIISIVVDHLFQFCLFQRSSIYCWFIVYT